MRKKINERLDQGKSHLSRYRLGYFGVGSLAIVLLAGCAQLKKMAVVGGVTSATAGAASALGLATVPTAIASGVAASVAAAYVGAKTSSIGENMPIAASCAPDNFFTLLGDLVSMSGYFLILVVAVPMLLGWILPGPLERKKKK